MTSYQSMKLRIKHKHSVHGKEWKLDRPDLGLVGKGYIWDVLIKNLKQYRHANHLPIGLGFEDEVEKAECETYPEQCAPADEVPRAARRLGIMDVVHGTQVMLAHWSGGRILVSDEEAERRAAICAKCPRNTDLKKPCSGLCDELASLIRTIIGSKKTSKSSELKNCEICGCYTDIAVYTPLAVQCHGVTEDMKKEFAAMKVTVDCWKECV